jgi:hypothetical protein
MIQPGWEHPSIQEKLGLSGQPINRIGYDDNDGHCLRASPVKVNANRAPDFD